MTVELAEIADFLSQTRPFSDLTDEERATIPPLLTMRYARRGTEIIRAGADNNSCFIIRSGMVDLFDPAGTLLDRRDVGDHFGYSTLLSSDPSLYTMTAVEDCVFLVISKEVFNHLNDQFVEVRRYYGGENARIRAVASKLRSTAASESLRTRVADLMETSLVTCSADATVQEAAQIMTEWNVSSLLVMESAGANQSPLVGIITDRDLRRRVLAEAKPAATLVSEVMTETPETISPDLLVFEAMLLMAERGYHHLPVHDGTRVVGMIVIGDLLRSLHTDPVYATATLARKSDISEIAEIAQNARRIVGRFIDRGDSGEEVSKLLTAVADAVTRRLVALAEEKLGPPPVSYAIAVLGSHGRGEMGLASDQDNALVLADDYDADVHADYFAALSDEICTNLDRVGYPLCTGDMMASNPAWRMTKSQWLRTFHGWITVPEAEALLHAQTFFDMRGVAGDVQLVEELRAAYLPLAQGSQRLHAHLAKLAAWREPPLGFFRGLVLEKGGEHAETLDIKKGGTAAVVQIARLFAVAAGLPQQSTRERLAASAGAGSVSRQGAQDLADAFEFLCTVQLHHQQAQFNAGTQPNNHIYPKRLSSLEREHLRDAFGVIRKLQQSLGAKYPIRAMS
ncbi:MULTISPECIES: DUF294 nucleotidyltransferase-like domain-containing protein [Corynebacterium]|uniref:Nucleotidyltransferase substrate binding domain-containing protein n=1 Tax=Corynebacterium amycolatum TaxID=43765 RepID=A0AB38XT02_CORAY|nr:MULTISPECIES: DUF294 nucleotidyltransferase-like domain-containing protein [Corynebacterium]AIN82621.1 cyclic nucleotide-binding domain protein [Corynebacterium sp. ATCC 6931]KAA9289753.1 cyclic nucleotide-binding/CBS domain-containing protein [Corynebacterium amycolatum]MBC6726714.1 histidine kinase [Corynebacterium amycolatum]MBC6758289.1 histidine kinase [Corynebacterium sp. LK24]MCG7244425.1 DUF294 nucleotidyltransferase-like domain-containing protein [Corynebacterium sp. ACRPX]